MVFPTFAQKCVSTSGYIFAGLLVGAQDVLICDLKAASFYHFLFPGSAAF